MSRVALILGLLAALLVPTAAQAHPLGNFTTNRFSRIEVSGHRLYVRYVLDMAEIPTFQAGRIDAHAYARRIAAGVRLELGGARARLVPGAVALAQPRGAGGLRTTRLEVVLRGPRLTRPSAVSYRDGNFAERIGWKEIVVGRDAPSVSDELRAYPSDKLESPLDVTAVSTRVLPQPGPERAPSVAAGAARRPAGREADSGFASLIGRDDLGVWIVLASLAVAFFWGAVHALSPGHGKAIVTAYLVGQRGTPRHALALGLIVTATHTVGVFALGLVTLLLSQWVVPEKLYPWLTLASGLLVVGIGGYVLRSRWRQQRTAGREPAHHHHRHDAGGDLSARSLLAVGVTGGLLPCPSALVVLLAAISLHRVAFGLLLIVAFSAGLALTITAIGLAAVLTKRAFGRLRLDGRVVGLLPTASALVILAVGVAMTADALPSVT